MTTTLPQQRRAARAAIWLTRLALLCAALIVRPIQAHEGEDHGPDKVARPTASAGTSSVAPSGASDREAPARLADGSLFVPKPVQRQWGLRTVRAVSGELSATVELNGRVVTQPGAGGRVQATQAGTVLAGPRGFPRPGMQVRRGEILAVLRPSLGSFERGSQKAELADLAAQLTVTEQRVARLAQLEGSVPAKEIEAARVEARGLRERLDARRGSLDALEPLRAPAGGIVSAVQVVLGQVVDAKELLFEIVDPARLAVEALTYDTALPGKLSGADAVAGDTRLRLRLSGAGLQLREQALPMVFDVVSSSGPLAVGQSVKVFARARINTGPSTPAGTGASGIAVPRAALVASASGDSMVWIHTEAERFAAHRVTHQPLDADTVAITSGLQSGDRVVTAGATLLAQVR